MKLAVWFIEKVKYGLNTFTIIRRAFATHYDTIINYFYEGRLYYLILVVLPAHIPHKKDRLIICATIMVIWL